MRQLIITIIIFSSPLFAFGQLLNSEFDEWVEIDTSHGEAYLDLVHWQTNNEHIGLNMFEATTPCIPIINGDDSGVAISTSYKGLDAIGSGMIRQTIPSEKLFELSYLSKCDSIFEEGACVVNIYNDSSQLLFTDSTKVEEPDYINKSVDLSLVNLGATNSITIEFVAAGEFFALAEFQGYSEFNLLNVEAKYTSSVSQKNVKDIFSIFPNPFLDKLHIKLSKDHNFEKCLLFDAQGKLVHTGNNLHIETSDLESGIYHLSVYSDDEIFNSLVVKK